MSQMIRRMLLTAGTVLPLLCFLSGCEQKTAEPKPPSPIAVSTMTTTAGDEPKWQTFTGRTESRDAVEVRPQVSGVIREVCFAEGARVEKGDLLYRIDPATFEAALRNSEARMRSAEAQLQRAEREYRRSAELLKTGALSAGHARAVLTLKTEKQQLEAAKKIIALSLSVRQAETLCKNMGKPPAPKKEPVFEVNYVAECEKNLSKHLGRGVKIVNGKRKGRFELEFYGEEDLQKLLDTLMKLEK